MEDQGKRLLLAVALIAVMWAVYVYFFAPKPKPPEKAVTPATTTTGGTQAAAGSTAPTAPGAPASSTEPVRSSCDASKAASETISTPLVSATVSACGGALSSWTLVGSQYGKKDPETGKRVPEDLVAVAARGQASFFPLQLSLPESSVALDPSATWTLTKEGETTVVARLTTAELELEKRFTLSADYALDVAITVKNISARELDARLAVALFGFQDPAAKKAGMFTYADPHYLAACHVGGEVHETEASDLRTTFGERTGRVRWAGIDHKFFMFVAAPVGAESMTCGSRRIEEPRGTIETQLRYPVVKLAVGASTTQKLEVYAGPKQLDRLEAFDERVGQDAKLASSVKLGWFGFLARPMLWLLTKFHGFVGNWGIAIIMLTIVVKLLTLYWTTKSMRSMKAMAKLKPKMDEIRAKYADDKQRQNVEMMNLYKTQNINPLGGCLPMLLQMPVWFALYSALGAAAELYQAPFFGWIQDLTRPDPYYVVPVVVAGLMFLQQKITPATGDSQQQKIMMYAMPLMFGAFSLVFPAGLTIYILTNTILTFIHQLYMNRTDDPAAAAPAAGKPAKA